jgi:hypothetical protein
LRLVAEGMPFPVNLDDEAPRQAGEVRRHLSGWELAPEPVAPWPPAKFLPQQHFRQAHLPS